MVSGAVRPAVAGNAGGSHTGGIVHTPNRCLTKHRVSSKLLSATGRALESSNFGVVDLQRCPHCGEIIHERRPIPVWASKVVIEYLEEQMSPDIGDQGSD
jgi:hypothetical protein